MNIIIFDDHHAIIDTLRKYFENVPECQILGSFTKGTDMLNFLTHNTVDIIITDLLSDEELGIDLIFMLRKKAPDSLIVVYSAITLDFIKSSCIEAGADLCVSKTKQVDILYQSIITLLCEQNIEHEIPIIKKSYNLTLTQKEKIIIEYMVSGMSSPEIADKLGLSHNTINNQKNHMIKKFACNNSTELVAKMFRYGFLKL